MMMKMWTSLLLASLGLALGGCGDGNSGSDGGLPDVADAGGDLGAGADDASDDTGDEAAPCETRLLAPGAEPFERLSDYCFFGGDTRGHRPNDDVLPYDVNSNLFADDSLKMRFIALPSGTSIRFRSQERWEWPVGATIVKTFYFALDEREPEGDRHIIETRLLVNEGESGWATYSYKWDEAQEDAVFTRLGSWVDLERIAADGSPVETRYRMPDKNSCKNCHGQDDVNVPLGPRTWQMNKSYDYTDGTANQLDKLEQMGWLAEMTEPAASQPALPDPFGEAELAPRARAYLEANCAHCHNPEGAGGPSGLDLSWLADRPSDYGVCKRPVAAGEGSGGFFHDIVPGDAASSIMVFRMASEDPGFKMPELPTLTSHRAGVELVSAWIDAMEPAGCPE